MRVWFNRGLSNVYDAVRMVREADPARRLTLFASHVDPQAAVLTMADQAEIEPAQADDAAYVEWCLAQCKSHGIDLMVPQRRRFALAAACDRFAAIGTRLSVTGTPDVLERLEHKDQVYADLAGTAVPVPPYRVVTTLEAFDAAVAELETQCELLCVKPTVAMYGAGFRELHRDGSAFSRILSGNNVATGLDTYRRALAESAQNRSLMVMPWLPGPEHSVDVLAQDGRVVTAVARHKHGSHQVLETTGPAVDIAHVLVGRYRLDGLFNLQTRDWQGVSYLLEVNSRMAGGMIYSCASGVVLPYWMVMLALGLATAEQVPTPRAGVRVAPVQGCIMLP